MSRNDDFTTGNLLDFSYHQNYHKRIDIDLPGQTDISITQQIRFIGIVEEDNGVTMFFIAEKRQKLFQTFL